MDRVYINIQRYGNMSAATVPVALCEAIEEGRVRPRLRCCSCPVSAAASVTALTWSAGASAVRHWV